MKLPDDATILRDRLEEHLSTTKLASKYHTDKRAVVKRLRKMGLSSNQYQNWGRGYRVWRGMNRKIFEIEEPAPPTIIIQKKKAPPLEKKLCMLCITPIMMGGHRKHLRDEHDLNPADSHIFFISESELQPRELYVVKETHM